VSLLTNTEIEEQIRDLEGWKIEGEKLVKEYQFIDFYNALSFVVKLGVEAEKLNHHPEILIHSYNKVKITTTTHEEGGITELDTRLADRLERI
jgi:4a-hydroxytetrahydrobiopterin dehydratase